MSNQNRLPVGFNEYLFSAGRAGILSIDDIAFPTLPWHFEQDIATVNVANLLAAFNDRELVNQILAVLPSNPNIGGESTHSWFRATSAVVLDGLDARLERLLDFPIVLPQEILIMMQGQDEASRRSIQIRYIPQVFMRATLNELGRHSWRLAEAFLARIRTPIQAPALSAPTQAPAPVPAPVPAPAPFQRRPPVSQMSSLPSSLTPLRVGVPNAAPNPVPRPQAQTTAPKSNLPLPTTTSNMSGTKTAPTAAPTPANDQRRYYCPGCEHSRPAGHFNDMNAHYFDNHARSNRRLRWLREQWESGAMGPWTKQEEKTQNRPRETVAEKRGRSLWRRDSARWRTWRRTNPEACERAAQQADGYTDFDERFVSDRFRNLDEKKKAAQKKKDQDARKDKDKDNK